MSRTDSIRKWVKVLLILIPLTILLSQVLPSNLLKGTKKVAKPSDGTSSSKGTKPCIESTEVTATFWGSVGSTTILKAYEGAKGVSFRIITPPCSAIYDAWTIENEKRTPCGLLFGFAKNRHERRSRAGDPGVLEYIAQGVYNLAFDPLQADGTQRHYSYTCDSLYEIDENGWLEVYIPMENSYFTKVNLNKVSLNFVINEPRVIVEWELPEGIESKEVSSGVYQLKGQWSSTEETDYVKVRWRIHENFVSQLKLDRINSKPLKLSKSITLYQIAGIPYGRHKTTIAILSQKYPSGGLLGKVVSCDWSGENKTLIPVYGESKSSQAPLAVDVPEEVIKRLEASIKVSEMYHQAKIFIRERRQSGLSTELPYKRLTAKINGKLTEITDISQRTGIVSPAVSLYASPELTEDRAYDYSLADRNIYFEGKGEQRRAGGRIEFIIPEFQVSRSSTGWFGKIWAEYSDSGKCKSVHKRLIAGIEMYNMDYGTFLRSEIAESSTNGNIQGAVLFEPVNGLRGQSVFWYDHLTGFRNLVKLKIFIERLEREGYLGEDLKQSGQYRHIQDKYRLLANDEIFCLDHGFINSSHRWPRGASARQQLRTYGVTDEKWLNKASDEPL